MHGYAYGLSVGVAQGGRASSVDNMVGSSANTTKPSAVGGIHVVGDSAFEQAVGEVRERAAAAGVKVFKKLDASNNRTEIIQSYNTGFNGGTSGGIRVGQVSWNMEEGAIVRVRATSSQAYKQSPALGLIHELGHALQWASGGSFAGKKLPERPVINGVEKEWANFYREPARHEAFEHGGISDYGKGLFEHDLMPRRGN